MKPSNPADKRQLSSKHIPKTKRNLSLGHNTKIHGSILCKQNLLDSLLSCLLSVLNHLNHIPKKTGEQTAAREKGEEGCDDQGVKLEVESSVCLSTPTPNTPGPFICPDERPTQPLLFTLRGEWRCTGDWKRGLEHPRTMRERDRYSEHVRMILYYLYTPVLSHFPSKICDPAILGFCSVAQHKASFTYIQVSKGDTVIGILSCPQKQIMLSSSSAHLFFV